MKQVSWNRIMSMAFAWAITAAVLLLIATRSITPNVADGIVSSLVGTFAGAWLAFRRDRTKDKIAEASTQAKLLSARDNQRAAALNRALFVLGSQHNEVIQVLNAIAPFKERPDRALMPALEPPGNSKLSQNIDDLMFILEEHSETLFDLMLAQQRFDAAIYVLKSRTTLHVDSFQVQLEKSGRIGDIKSEQDIIDAVGVRIYKSLFKATNEVFEHFEGADQTFDLLQVQLSKLSVEILPTFKFIRFERIPTDASELLWRGPPQ